MELFSVLDGHHFATRAIIDRVVEVLDGTNKQTEHDQIKVVTDGDGKPRDVVFRYLGLSVRPSRQ